MKNKFIIFLIIFSIISGIVYPLTDSEKELFEAVKTANTQKINDILKRTDVDINARDTEGYTPLLRAVYYNKRASVTTLLQTRGLDKESKLTLDTEINGWYLDGATAVMLSAFFGYDEVLGILVDSGCSLDSKDLLDGALSIHIASANGNLSTVKKIISYNRNYANARTIDNSTPLMWAAMKDKTDVVAYLTGISDIEAIDVEGWNALHYASVFASAKTLKVIIDAQADINALENDGNTALDLAKDDEIRTLLVSNGAKKSSEIYTMNNAKSEIDEDEDEDDNEYIEEEVVIAGYDDNSEYIDNLEFKNLKPEQIQFLINIKDGDTIAINKYIQNSTDVNFTNEYGFTPIAYAVIYNRADSLETLLQSQSIKKDPVFGKDAEFEGWFLDGATPLILAAYLGYDDIVDLLLQNGANILHKDNVDGAMAIHSAAANGSLEALINIISYNKDTINALDNTGFTPLHWAVMYSQENIVKELLDNNANPNIADDNKDTPIHLAAQNGDNNIIEMLLAKGADVNTKNSDGNTALHFATYSSYVSVVKTLLNNNADKNIVNNESQKPIDIAIGNEDTEIIKLLNKRNANNSKWWILN